MTSEVQHFMDFIRLFYVASWLTNVCFLACLTEAGALCFRKMVVVVVVEELGSLQSKSNPAVFFFKYPLSEIHLNDETFLNLAHLVTKS